MAQVAHPNETQQAWQAILTLYRNSPTEQQAAGKWLNNFAETPAAPEVALNLLRASHPPEIQFFSANMLLTVVKRRWLRLDPHLQQQIQARLSHELGVTGDESATLSKMAIQRVVLALGTIYAVSGPESLSSAIGPSLALAQKGNVLCAVELLAALADAANDLHRLQKSKAVAALSAHAPQVMPLILHGLQDQTGSSGLRLAALRCLLAWLKLDESGQGDALMSPGAFATAQRHLFSKLLELIGHPDEDIATAATETIVFLMSSWSNCEDPEADETALRETAAAVVRFCTITESPGENLLHNAAQIAAALANRDTQAIADRIPEAVPLAAIALQALGSGHQAAAEAAIEYFDMLNAVPIAQRHPQLGQPVYSSMLPALLRLASFPAEFSSWEEYTEDDSDSFHSFRDNVLSDALDTCQKLLQQNYLSFFAESMRNATSWQIAEAAMFALRLYRRRASLLAFNAASPNEEDQFFLDLFSQMTNPSSSTRHQPFCMDAAVQLISANSAWITSSPQEVFEASVGLMLTALQYKQSSRSAASALKFICSGVPKERAAALFNALLPVIIQLAQTGSEIVSWEDKAEVVRGAASLMGIARLAKADMGNAARQLAMPFALQAERAAVQEGGPPSPDYIAGPLKMLAAAVERMEFLLCEGASSEEHPAAIVALRALPHLQAVSDRAVAREVGDVTAALCQVFKQCLQALGSAGNSALDQIIGSLGKIFHGDPQACLQVITTAVDMCQDWGTSLTNLGNTISQLSSAIQPNLQGSGVNPELAAAWFNLLAHCLIDDRTHRRKDLVLKVAEFVPQHFTTAVHLLQRQEEDLCRSLVAFIRSALGMDASDSGNTAERCIQSQGGELVTAILRAVALSFPQRILRSLASLLHSLLNHRLFGQAVRKAFAGSMAADEVLVQSLDDADRAKICQIALELSPLLAGSFGALIKDMAGIARKELSSDVLLSYELHSNKTPTSGATPIIALG